MESAIPADALTGVSLFAGIGGIDRALTLAGVRVVAAVEIDPARRAVLARHFPDVTLFDDVQKVTGDQLRAAGFVPERGVLAGGWPCTDLSVAGRRLGLGEGTRSGLYWHCDRLVAELRPAWVLYENVPGLLSAVCPDHDSAGSDLDDLPDRDDRNDDGFPLGHIEPAVSKGGRGACEGGCFAAHGGAMGLVLGSLGDRGYGFAYRVLDAQHFGVPQRRRRVLIVGRAGGDARGPVEVLLEPEGRAGDPAPGQEAGQDVAGTLGGGSGARGWAPDTDRMTFIPVATTLTAREGKGPNSDARDGNLVMETLRSHPRPGSNTVGAMMHAAAVRRLTPLECERLQGFPDGWTDGQSDASRYRQLGDSVAVPCIEWVARRLVGAHQRYATGRAA